MVKKMYQKSLGMLIIIHFFLHCNYHGSAFPHKITPVNLNSKQLKKMFQQVKTKYVMSTTSANFTHIIFRMRSC